MSVISLASASQEAWNSGESRYPIFATRGVCNSLTYGISSGALRAALFAQNHAGVFSDMNLIADLYKPDLVLVPIGGGQFAVNPQHAAMITKEMIKPKAVIPLHCLTNPGLPGTPADYVQALGDTGVRVLAINPGERVEF